MEANIFLLLLIVTMDIVSGVKQEQRPIPYKIWTLYRKLITPGSVMARSNTACTLKNDCYKEIMVHLENNAYGPQEYKAGKYTLQPFKENGICYWKQDDGPNGLWFNNETNHWVIGSLNSTDCKHGHGGVGQNCGGLFAVPESECPTSDLEWSYIDYDDDWHLGGENISVDGYCSITCADRVKLSFESDNENYHGPVMLHPEIYQEYNIEPGLVEGRTHYTSRDGRYALVFCGGSWWIQHVFALQLQGECHGIAASESDPKNCCVQNAHDWSYYVPSISEWVYAKQGLIVTSASQK